MSKSKFPRLIDTVIAVFILVAGLFCFNPGPARAQGQSLATITTARGTVEVRRSGTGNFRAVRAQAALASGDVIRTGAGSGAAVLFSDGTQIRLGAGATLEVTPPAAVRGNTSFFKLLAGEIWARLRPGRAGQTKYANLVVRGTEVRLLVTETETELTVLEGRVEFFNQLGTVSVSQGQQSAAREGQAPTNPVTIANPGLTVEWRFDLDRTRLARDRYFVTSSSRDAAAIIRGLEGRGVSATNGDPASRLQLAQALHDAERDEASLAVFQSLTAADIATLPANTRWSVDRQAADVQAALDDNAGAETRLRTALADTTRTAPQRAVLLNGLAWLALEQDKPEAAITAANEALATSANDPEARLVLGLAQLRNGDHSTARTTLGAIGPNQTPTWGPPVAPQAQSWRALIELGFGDTSDAIELADSAVKLNPASGVARATASLAAFAAGDTKRAVREAQIATTLDPQSINGILALAQAELASGNTNKAAEAAARATALDPEFPEAHYILGLADAGRRDYLHSDRSLREALRLDPGYAPAVAALARVQIRAGRPAAGLTLLKDWQAKNETTPQIQAALGEVYFRMGDYNESIAEFEKMAKADPKSALGWAGLCRVALDAYQLNKAINAGRQAVRLAPNVGEYHAILGLAYKFSNAEGQANREFRTALALDPNNALALVQLGLLQTDSAQFQTERNTFVNSLQGFFLDPGISRDILRGGTDAFVTPFVGDESGVQAGGRVTAADGRINAFGQVSDFQGDANRPNTDSRRQSGIANLNIAPGNKTNIVAQVNRRRDKFGVPGTENSLINEDDNAETRANTGSIGLKQGIGDRGSLWLNLFSRDQEDVRTNPNADNSLVQPSVNFRPSVLNATSHSQALAPEIRFDFATGSNLNQPGQVTFGYARPRAQSKTFRSLLIPGLPGSPNLTGSSVVNQDFTTEIFYAQIRKQFSDRLSISGQLRHEKNELTSSSTGRVGLVNFDSPQVTQSNDQWLPSGVLNLRLGGQSSLRFSGSRRHTNSVGSLLAPIDTLINTEPTAFFNGFADVAGTGTLNLFQVDLERYGSQGDLAKIFLFYTSGNNIIYDFGRYANTNDVVNDGNIERNFLRFNTLRRTGVGLRYERPLTSLLFTQFGATYASTSGTARIPNLLGQEIPTSWSGQAAPYNPRFTAFASVNYLSPGGYKLQLRGNYTGNFYQDTQRLGVTTRPRFGASTTYDLYISREPSVRNEVFLQVSNLFNSRQIVYNGISYNRRLVTLGWTKRF